MHFLNIIITPNFLYTESIPLEIVRNRYSLFIFLNTHPTQRLRQMGVFSTVLFYNLF